MKGEGSTVSTVEVLLPCRLTVPGRTHSDATTGGNGSLRARRQRVFRWAIIVSSALTLPKKTSPWKGLAGMDCSGDESLSYTDRDASRATVDVRGGSVSVCGLGKVRGRRQQCLHLSVKTSNFRR